MCALAPVLNLVPFVRDTVQGHWMWLLLFVLVSCLRTLNCQFVRARNLVRLYALDGILCTLTNLLFNVLFLSGLNLGAQGWILALICSDACSALFLFFVSSIWRYMGGRNNTKLWRKMLVYSVPLISASIFWTVTTPAINCSSPPCWGAEWNGLFAACYQAAHAAYRGGHAVYRGMAAFGFHRWHPPRRAGRVFRQGVWRIPGADVPGRGRHHLAVPAHHEHLCGG